MKKIVFICTQLEAGGAQNVIIKICNALNKTQEFDCEPWFLYEKKKAFPNSFKRVISKQKPTSLLGYLRLLYKTFIQLKKNKPDVLITFTHYSNVLIQPLAYFAGINTRIANHRNPRYTYSTFVRLLDSVWGLTGVYHKVIMVSETVKESFDMVSKKYLSKTEIVYNGIDELKYSSDSENEIRKKWNIELDKFILLNVGRLAKQKNQDFLLEIINDLNNMQLIIVGEGELRKELENKIERYRIRDKVILTGQIDKKEVYELMKISSIFLMPSKYEGMSNALLESLRAGIPVIASDVPAQAELLKNNNEQFGILLDNDDKDAWKRVILEISESNKLQKFWKNKSIERSRYFTNDKMIKDYISIL